MKKILLYFFVVLLIGSSIVHLVKPEVYLPLIPDFIPANIANIVAFVTELIVGLLLVLPKYRRLGGLGFMLLMIVFLPIHIWDLMRDTPFIGSKAGAFIRLILQFLMIYAGWRIWKGTWIKSEV